MQWIDETALANWATRLDARAQLADMVADLIRASVRDASRFRFPGGDSSQLRGWDGNLWTAEGQDYNFVPSGKSKWEFGTGPGAAKATSDYTKRSNQTSPAEMAENTLVLVNLERWDTPTVKITDWEDARTAEGKWKEVWYLDAVELVHWLDLHPAVAALYARNVLRTAPKEGALGIDEFWEMYSARFNPMLHEKVVIGDRQEIADSLVRKLSGPAQSIFLGAETSIEVVAFTVAAIRSSDSETRKALERRTLIVETEAAARFLSSHSDLTFITTKDGDTMSGVLSTKGPTVSAATGVQARRHQTLSRSSASGMVDGFMAMGFDRETGYELAHRCGRSLTILERLLYNQSYREPEWVARANDLKPAFLAGGWSARQDLDKAILRDLSGKADYESFEAVLLPSILLSDPPIDRVGELWQTRAPIDAFSFYARYIGEIDLRRLRDAVIKVFSHIAPEPSREDRYNTDFSSSADYSKWLRDGLALTLVIIATMDTVGGLQLPNGTAQQYVDETICALPDWGRGHTLIRLCDQTALVAEAAPYPFLSALESMLGGEKSDGSLLFTAVEDGLFGPTSPHIHVLWALEVLAWDPKLLLRVALILGKLAELDTEPASNMVNRPINSLRAILLSWAPCTHAPLQQRIHCLDQVLGTCAAIAWPLLMKLLPRAHDTLSPTQKPRLRDTSPISKEALTFGVVWDAQHAIVGRAIQHASGDSAKIVELVGLFASFRPEDRTAVLQLVDDHLTSEPKGQASDVWCALREELAEHAFFSDSEWAMQGEELDRIEALLNRHRPDDPWIEEKRLFDDWHPHVGRHTRDDYDPDDLRRDALDCILSKEGVNGVLSLTRAAKLPNLVGPALERTKITEQQLLELLSASIDPPAPGELAPYVAAIGARRYGQSWAEELGRSVLPALNSTRERASLLVGWPLTDETWRFAMSLGQDVYDDYWRLVHFLPQEGPVDLLLRSIDEFRRAGRSVEVFGAAHRRLGELPTNTILALLDEAQVQLSGGKVRGGAVMLGYYLGAAFGELQSRADAPREVIARHEFTYLPLLSERNRNLVLYDMMASAPDLYVDVLSQVFRGKNSAPRSDLTEAEKSRIHVSFRLLSSFNTLPGSESGIVDPTALAAWTDEVRRIAAERDLSEISDQYIGHLFARSEYEASDSSWPALVICEEIERLASTEVEKGFAIECFNKRGVVTKALHEGGGQERELAQKYRRWASETTRFSRVSSVLEAIADRWMQQAKEEDLRAEADKMRH